MPLRPDRRDACKITTPLFDNEGNESGLCTCGGVYDEYLYEMQLRRHWPGLPEGADLEACLNYIEENLPDDHPWKMAQQQMH